jgi:hypothetical protein
VRVTREGRRPIVVCVTREPHCLGDLLLLDAVGDLHARTVAFFEPRLLRSANFRDYDQVPALDFRDPPASRLALLAALAALLLPAAALVAFGTRTLRRSGFPTS